MMKPGGPAPDLWHFDGWIFDPASGDLWRAGGNGPPDVAPGGPPDTDPSDGDSPDGRTREGARRHRLQPQPAQVLEILLARAGEVVPRETLVEVVWSDTKVEFDQAINYCVRQIRIALDESATDPRYIETLPRRGYRFLVPATRRTGSEAAAVAPARIPGSGRRPLRTAAAAAVLLLAGAAVATWIQGTGASDPPPIVAIQVLRTDGSAGSAEEAVRVAELLTAELTARTSGRLRVVGPTTTAAFGPERADVGRLRDDVGATWVVGGSLSPGRADGLFLEVVDTRDGAHLWARASDPSEPSAAAVAADSIARHLVR